MKKGSAHLYFIGIDVGTSAVKLLLVDEEGKIHNSASAEYPLFFPQPGWSEQNPADWWDAVGLCFRELLDGQDASLVAGIGVGGILACTAVIASEYANNARRGIAISIFAISQALSCMYLDEYRLKANVVVDDT